MVQRHLTSIYKKTGTLTRAGLTKVFPTGQPPAGRPRGVD